MEKLSSRLGAGIFERRSFMRGAAAAGLCAAAAPALALLAEPAEASNWRGLVGLVKPRANDPVVVEIARLLPPGIGLAVSYLNFTTGSREEMERSFDNYEKNIAYLASQKCDLISIEGAPPFMMLGPEGETRLVDGWKEKYKADMFTSSQNQVNVLRAMNIKKIFGVAAFGRELYRIRDGRDSHIHALAEQRLHGFTSAGDLGQRDRKALLLVIAKCLRNMKRLRADRVLVDRNPDVPDRRSGTGPMAPEQPGGEHDYEELAHPFLLYGRRPHVVHIMGDGIMKSASSNRATSLSNSCCVRYPASIIAVRRRS